MLSVWIDFRLEMRTGKFRLHKMSINLEFTDLLLLPVKNKISVSSFHIHFI